MILDKMIDTVLYVKSFLLYELSCTGLRCTFNVLGHTWLTGPLQSSHVANNICLE